MGYDRQDHFKYFSLTQMGRDGFPIEVPSGDKKMNILSPQTGQRYLIVDAIAEDPAGIENEIIGFCKDNSFGSPTVLKVGDDEYRKAYCLFKNPKNSLGGRASIICYKGEAPDFDQIKNFFG